MCKYVISDPKTINYDSLPLICKIYKKGFEISFPFPFNSIMKFGKVLPYKLYFKITEKKFSKK